MPKKIMVIREKNHPETGMARRKFDFPWEFDGLQTAGPAVAWEAGSPKT
jgi:hypothetical protein